MFGIHSKQYLMNCFVCDPFPKSSSIGVIELIMVILSMNNQTHQISRLEKKPFYERNKFSNKSLNKLNIRPILRKKCDFFDIFILNIIVTKFSIFLVMNKNKKSYNLKFFLVFLVKIPKSKWVSTNSRTIGKAILVLWFSSQLYIWDKFR